MFINFVALMLVNLVASLALLAVYVWRGLDEADGRRWGPAFAIAGLVQLLTGLVMVFSWPLPGSHNIAFGEPSVLFGALFLGAGLAMSFGLDLLPMAIYGFFAGLYAIVAGVRLVNLGMTRAPLLSMIGYLLPGFAGLLAVPAYYMRRNRTLRLVGALLLVGAAAVWAVTGYGAVWGHLADYASWLPAGMRGQ
ncbi:MAG: DUF981 family protein [Anaerolineae bacterium]